MAPAMRYLSPSSIACFTAFIVVCVGGTPYWSECPKVTSPSCPCTSTEDNYVLRCPTLTVTGVNGIFAVDVDVQCSTNDVHDFSELKGTRMGNAWKFTMHRCKLHSLPLRQLLENMGVSYIFVHNRKLDAFTSYFESFQVLNLENNGLKHIGTNDLYGMDSLKEINMANNMLTFENSSSPSLSPMHNCKILEDLQLSNNFLTKIFPDWRNIKSLKKLNLSHNNISRLEAADLHFGESDINVDIRNNNISELDILDSEKFHDDNDYRYALNDGQSIKNKISHRYFYIDGNPIKCGCKSYSLLEYNKNQITAEVTLITETEGVDNIQCNPSPMLEGNIPLTLFSCLFKKEYSQICPKQCTCELRRSDKAVVVDCHKRNLTSVPTAVPNLWFSNHTEIDLSGNRITSVKSPLGPGYNRVVKYNFSENMISDIDLTVFSSKLQVLAIDRNNITQINESSIEFLRNAVYLTELALHGNPWTCDCKTNNFVTLIKSYYISKKVKLFDNTTCKNGKVIFNISDTELCHGEPFRTVSGEPFRTVSGEPFRTVSGEPFRTVSGEPNRTVPAEPVTAFFTFLSGLVTGRNPVYITGPVYKFQIEGEVPRHDANSTAL